MNTSTGKDRKDDHKTHHSLKRNTHNFSQESVEVDVSLSEYLNAAAAGMPSSGNQDVQLSSGEKSELECIKVTLDNLFNLAEGSTDYDKRLRYTFYKVLL